EITDRRKSPPAGGGRSARVSPSPLWLQTRQPPANIVRSRKPPQRSPGPVTAYGNRWRQFVPRYPLHLLQSKRMVAERQRLLSEKSRRCLSRCPTGTALSCRFL